MKNRGYRLITFLFVIISVALTGCGTKAENGVAAGSGPDYSDMDNWAYYGIGDGKYADLFLICPTADVNDEYNMSMDDEATKELFLGALNMERGIYEDSTRMYAPYYRQAAMKVYGLDRADWEQYMQIAYSDVSAAFSYYLEHENNGRPIVLAGFSQGADMCYRLLEEYFGDEKLYDRLVSVYAIGWPCTAELVDDYPQIRPAVSADDLGTVISFDCEAEDVKDTFIWPDGIKAYTINPLTWTTGPEPADKSLNKGACFTDYSGNITKEVKELCGCYIDERRNVIKVTDIDPSDFPAYLTLLQDGAYHIYDYQFFYRNLQENVANRVNLFCDQNHIRVGYYENEVFQEGAQEGKVKTGYAYEYYQKLSEYTGWQYEYVYGEFGDLYQQLLDGDIDLLAGLAKKPDRESLIGYPDAPMGNETYNLVRHDADDDITADPSTLNGKKIGVLDSAMKDDLNDFLNEHNVKAEVMEFRDYEPLFEAFDRHDVDVLAAEGDGAYGRPHAELLYSFGTSSYYLCVDKTEPELLAELNAAQTELSVDEPNYINSLRSKYYPISISSRAFSASEKEWLGGHDVLRVGYLNHYLPYCDTDSAGNVTGVVNEIIPRILEELAIEGITVSYTSYDSFDDMIAALNIDEIDLAFPVGGGLYYSEENGILQSGAVVSAATELVYKGEYNDETTESFAVNENNRMQYYFVKTYYPDAEVKFYDSIEECLEAVGDGRAGCTTLNGLRANDILRNSRYKDLSRMQTTHDDDRCFGVRIGDEGLLKFINRGINVLGSDYVQSLAFRYTDQLYKLSFADMMRENALFFGGVIFITAMIIILMLVRDRRRSKRELIDKEEARKELEKTNEELREQQKRREQQDRMITALASDYRCVYHVDLDNDDAVCYRADPDDMEQTPEGVHFPYHERFAWYAEHSVAPAYREGFLEFIEPANVRKNLEKDPIAVYRYLAQRAGKEYYEMIRMAGVRHAENRDDHIVHAVGLGLTVIDTQMRDDLAKNQALGEALSAAEEASKAKTAFLSSMSHEIRTPMNAIIGLDSLALRNESLPDETREYLEKIGGSARHLLGLINDILDMSRIESGRLVLRKEEFSFSSMLEQLNTMVMSQCGEKGLHYECRVIGGVSDYYIGDDMKLKQVLINILSNAIKFTDAPGSVTLLVERTAVYGDHSTVKFVIKDTGIGMDQTFIPKIFDAFTQEDSSRNNKYGSTGLGMAITKNIVELMNGTISVSSEKNVGTEITVVVTLGNCDHQGYADYSVNPKDMHILVVDDEEVAAEHARIVLDELGIKADTCFSGAEAMNMLEVHHAKHEPYNLVLLDWKMPEMDGIEVAKEIRKRYDKETTVIILTSFNWDEIMDEAMHIGVDSFLAKPLFASNVIDEFERIARKNNMSLYKEKKRADLKGKRILLAEDVEINAEIMEQIILMKEAMIDHAVNGRVVLEMFEKSPEGYYDAILMDVRMPEMDGLEAAASIRALDRPDAAVIPIIALTANAFDEDVQRSLQVGMNAHLSKPVEPDLLYRTLEELIWEAEAETEA